MARHVRPPKTIAEYGGLEAYLEATAAKHNGLRLKDLLFRVNPKRRHVVPKTVIGEDFNVTAATIYSWLRILGQERSVVNGSKTSLAASSRRTERAKEEES